MTGVTTVGSGSFSPIYCPLTVFDSVSWVIAYVWDKSSTANVSCTVYAYDETGSVQYSATRASSGVDTSAPQQLSWDMSSVTVKYATMECSVPQTASLGNTSGIAQMIVYY
jgi:hypothetical protein